MPEREKRKRPAPISYRPPKAMREEFARRVAVSGMTANAFITQSIFERDPPRQVRRAPVNTAEIARLVGECARLRDRLEAIEANGAGEEMEALVAEAILHLTEIRTACFEALGRGSRSNNGGGDHDDDHDGDHHHQQHQQQRNGGGGHGPSPEGRPS